jgi:SpoVK/Ycf46/Vps4 family AAA+-type ATPase
MFHEQIFVGVPDSKSRKEMVASNLLDVSHELSDPDDIDAIAQMTYGWSGSDIQVF